LQDLTNYCEPYEAEQPFTVGPILQPEIATALSTSKSIFYTIMQNQINHKTAITIIC